MRVVVVVGGLGAALEPPEVGAAITTGWRAAAPADELVVFPAAGDGLGAALDGAELALVVAAAFDWQSLRSSSRGRSASVDGRRRPSAWTRPTPSPTPHLPSMRRPFPPEPSRRWPNVSRIAGVVDPDR
jgi:hypothetical protein